MFSIKSPPDGALKMADFDRITNNSNLSFNRASCVLGMSRWPTTNSFSVKSVFRKSNFSWNLSLKSYTLILLLIAIYIGLEPWISDDLKLLSVISDRSNLSKYLFVLYFLPEPSWDWTGKEINDRSDIYKGKGKWVLVDFNIFSVLLSESSFVLRCWSNLVTRFSSQNNNKECRGYQQRTDCCDAFGNRLHLLCIEAYLS